MNLYLKMLWVWLRCLWRPRLGMHDAVELSLRVWPGDLDFNLHMNNSRFLSVLDLAAIELLVRSGFMKILRAVGASPVKGGAIISYRKQLRPFEGYRVRVQYAGSDPLWHIFAFSFIRKDGSVAAKGMFKGVAHSRRYGLIAAAQLWSRYEALTGHTAAVKQLPEAALLWLQAEQALTTFSLPSEVQETPCMQSVASSPPFDPRTSSM